MAAPSSQPKTSRGGVIRLSDGTGTPVTLTIPFTVGDAELGQIMAFLNEEVIITARTQVIGVTRGKPSLPTFKFSVYVGNIVGSNDTAPGTATEFVTGKGSYDANVSTLGANREITVDIRQTIEGTAWGDTADETIDCEDVLLSATWKESEEGNMLTFEGKILGSVIVTNNTNVVTYAQAA
jgi:hypothetical protein